MIPDPPAFLTPFVDAERFARILAIPDSHFYGLRLERKPEGAVMRARYSPGSKSPKLIVADGTRRVFRCTCGDFQKMAGLPTRLGRQLCDHLVRALSLLDPEDQQALDVGADWTTEKATTDFERNEVLAQTTHLLQQGDALSALSELSFGMQSAVLRDMDVADVLEQIDPDAVAGEDLPEAMRFIRVALQRGFTRNTQALAGAWIDRFALNVDTFAPFEDVAPVALWFQRWASTPDIHFDQIRQRILGALEKARIAGHQGASWWLLYRAISRAGARPPENCVNAWKKAILDMRLALVNPARINEFTKLLASFGIKALGVGENYERMVTASIRRARERRMHFLLRLADAHRLTPFLRASSSPYAWAGDYVIMELENGSSPLSELILTSIGYAGPYLPTTRLFDNWPIIRRCCIETPEFSPELAKRLRAAWPDPDISAVAVVTTRRSAPAAVASPEANLVVRWAPASPELVNNSPFVSHQENRIFIPVRGGSHWPDFFGLSLCRQPTAMGRRLFTVQVVSRLDLSGAIALLRQGATWVGPPTDPVRLLAQPPDRLSAGELLNLHRLLQKEGAELNRATWIPDRADLQQRIDSGEGVLRAWARRRLWETFCQGGRIDPGSDIGLLFGRHLQIVPGPDTLEALAALAPSCESHQVWLEKAARLLIDTLPSLDRHDDPIDVNALVGSPLEGAIPAVVKRRKREIGAVRFEQDRGRYNLRALAKTVYGAMILENLELAGRTWLRKGEADELIRALGALDMGVETLPLFSALSGGKKDQG